MTNDYWMEDKRSLKIYIIFTLLRLEKIKIIRKKFEFTKVMKISD